MFDKKRENFKQEIYITLISIRISIMFSIHEKKVLILYFCHKKNAKKFFPKNFFNRF